MPLNPPQAYRKTEFTHRRGERISQPLASDVLTGTLYYVVDEAQLEISDGVNWQVYSGLSSSTSAFVSYSYSVATGTPPGAQQIRFNAGFPYTTVTRLYVWNITSDGQDIRIGLRRIQPGAVIYVQDKNDNTQWASFQVTIDPIDHTTWVEYDVVHVAHGLAIGGGQLVLIQAGPGPTYAPPPHAPSHETGGSDAIAHLSGGVIDSGTVAAARIGPAGSDKQVQFNDSSALGADSGLTYDKATDTLTAGAVTVPTGPIILGTNPASAGQIRLANATGIRSRNVGNTGDIESLITYTDDKVYVGGFANDAGLILRSTVAINVNRGITFPSTPVPSSDVNCFDEYKEGTFTPTITADGGASGQAYSVQSGEYIKEGRKVSVQGYVTVSTLGTMTGFLMLGGLPYTSSASTFGGLFAFEWSGFGVNFGSVGMRVVTSDTRAYIIVGIGGGGTASVPIQQVHIVAGFTLIFSGFYFTTD